MRMGKFSHSQWQKKIRSKDISEFGLEMCFKRLVQDVDDLVKNGIDLSIGDFYPICIGQYKKGD